MAHKSDVENKKQYQSTQSPPETSLKNIPSVWKPSGSPSSVKKEFRPVRLNTYVKSSASRTEQEVWFLHLEIQFIGWRITEMADSCDINNTYLGLFIDQALVSMHIQLCMCACNSCTRTHTLQIKCKSLPAEIINDSSTFLFCHGLLHCSLHSCLYNIYFS